MLIQVNMFSHISLFLNAQCLLVFQQEIRPWISPYHGYICHLRFESDISFHYSFFILCMLILSMNQRVVCRCAESDHDHDVCDVMCLSSIQQRCARWRMRA